MKGKKIRSTLSEKTIFRDRLSFNCFPQEEDECKIKMKQKIDLLRLPVYKKLPKNKLTTHCYPTLEGTQRNSFDYFSRN